MNAGRESKTGACGLNGGTRGSDSGARMSVMHHILRFANFPISRESVVERKDVRRHSQCVEFGTKELAIGPTNSNWPKMHSRHTSNQTFDTAYSSEYAFLNDEPTSSGSLEQPITNSSNGSVHKKACWNATLLSFWVP